MRYAARGIGMLVPALLLGCFFAGEGVYADIRTSAFSPGGATVAYRPDSFQSDSPTINGKTYTRFSCDGHIGQGAPGAPLLPARTVLVAVPKGNIPAIEISTIARRSREGVTVIPHPAFAEDGSGFTGEVYREDTVRYSLSGFQPSGFVTLGGRHEFDTFTLWEIIFSPVLFDAHASTAAILDSLTLNLSWAGQLIRAEHPGRVPEDILNRDALVAPDAARAFKTSGVSSSPFASGDWYRITLADSGMYAVTGAELAGAGFSAGNVRTDHIRLYYGGGKILETIPHTLSPDNFREVAIKVSDMNGDGLFGQDDSVVFFGESLSRLIARPDTAAVVFQNHPYSRANVYWLTVSETGNPRRMEKVDASPSSELPVRAAFREILHMERENSLEYPDSGIHWYWDGIKGATSKSFSFRAPGAISGDSLQVRVRFLNPTVDKNGYLIAHSHSVDIYVNDAGPFALSLPGTNSGTLTASLSGILPEGNNFLKISRTAGTPDGTVYLDWFEIEYDRKLEFSQSGMEVYFRGNGEPSKYVISGVLRPSLEIYDTSDPYTLLELTGASHDAAGRTLSFQA
ncbi:MAG: hypothetical protein ACYC9O_11120, partial [Candidatus Latescibacterota bacterium]